MCRICKSTGREPNVEVHYVPDVVLDGVSVPMYFAKCLTCGGMTDMCLTSWEVKARVKYGWYSNIDKSLNSSDG